MTKWPPPIPPNVLSTLTRNRYELLFVAALTGVAAFLRIYNLAGLPQGLHGDEAVTGLDALRVMREGWIGPYVGSALGQPAGPLYFTAFIFMLSDDTLFTSSSGSRTELSCNCPSFCQPTTKPRE